MKLRSIVYSESFQVMPDHWVKLGMKADLEPGESLEKAYKECHDIVEYNAKALFPAAAVVPITSGERKADAASLEVANLLKKNSRQM